MWCPIPQEEVLRGKPKVLGTIEELERLTPLLKEALQEERSTLEASIQTAAEGAARAAAQEEAALKIRGLEEVSSLPHPSIWISLALYSGILWNSLV